MNIWGWVKLPYDSGKNHPAIPAMRVPSGYQGFDP